MDPVRELPYWPAAKALHIETGQMAASDYVPTYPNLLLASEGVSAGAVYEPESAEIGPRLGLEDNVAARCFDYAGQPDRQRMFLRSHTLLDLHKCRLGDGASHHPVRSRSMPWRQAHRL
jgi:hypothetical protein